MEGSGEKSQNKYSSMTGKGYFRIVFANRVEK